MEAVRARAGIYELLKTVLAPPAEGAAAEAAAGTLGGWIRCAVEQYGRAVPRGCPPETRAELCAAAADLDALGPGAAPALEEEYTRLFVSDFPVLGAPPFESFYVERRVLGRPALDCLEAYEAEGLRLLRKGALPDHVATQLEYLHFLCLLEADARAEGDREGEAYARSRARSFHEAHTSTWIPAFCARLRQHARLPLYRGVARFLDRFLAAEHRDMALVVFCGPREEVQAHHGN